MSIVHPSPLADDPDGDGGILTINLAAIARNWLCLSSELKAGCRAAAVIKADAYGLGAAPVASALYEAGCRDFFVALLSEAAPLQALLPSDATLYVLDGLRPGTERECLNLGVVPSIFTLKQLQAWASVASKAPCVIKVDTGMTRLGFDRDVLLQNTALLQRVNPVMFVSHLSSAEQPNSEANRLQLQRFVSLRERLQVLFPQAQFSLGNSSGVFLGPDYQFDCVRPGAALYGVNPSPGSKKNPVESVLNLRLPVIQLRDAQAGESVGYGGAHKLVGGERLAVVLGGYADGIRRSLGGVAEGVVSGQRVPVVGRISMDTTVFDVSALSEPLVEGESFIELLGDEVGVDELAELAGTIGYEILTGLGRRFQRRYIKE